MNNCNYYFSLFHLIDNDDEQQKLNEEYEEWLSNNKLTTDSFDYVLMKDINEYNESVGLIEFMKSNGWEYRKQLSRSITKRGYKKMLEN